MVAPKKAFKHLEHVLTDISSWISQHAHGPNQPKETSVRDIAAFISKLEKKISHFVEHIVEEPSTKQVVASEFKTKCENLQSALAVALLDSKELDQTAVNALKRLHQVIVGALTKLSKVFKDVLGNVSKTPSFTPHHGKPEAHLKSEQRFKSHAVHGPQADSFRHYNIPPGKKG